MLQLIGIAVEDNDTKTTPTSNPINKKNIAYTFHCYPNKYVFNNPNNAYGLNSNVITYGWKIEKAIKSNLTVITTEMAPINPSLTETDRSFFNTIEMDKFINYYENNFLSFFYFKFNCEWSNGDETSQWRIISKAKQGENVQNKFINFIENLTTSGEYFYSLMTKNGFIKKADYDASYSSYEIEYYYDNCFDSKIKLSGKTGDKIIIPEKEGYIFDTKKSKGIINGVETSNITNIRLPANENRDCNGRVTLKLYYTGIKIEKKYDSVTNKVKVNANIKTGFNKTKQTWSLSKDKKVYTKTYSENGIYKTTFEDIDGNRKEITFEINEIDKQPPVVKIYEDENEDGTVTIRAESNEELGETKQTWTLSKDKKTYTKIYETNGEHRTSFEDKVGNKIDVTFNVTKCKFVVKIEKNYDNVTNKVNVKAIVKTGFNKTKQTWSLSEDKKVYTKTYSENGIYKTTFEDINGNREEVTFEVTEIDKTPPVIKIYEDENEDGTVLIRAESNEELSEIKTTWSLSENKRIYRKKYGKNGSHTTTFTDKYGNEIPVTFKVTKCKMITNTKLEYNNETNTVKVSVDIKTGFNETKQTWSLNEDKKVYTKTYSENGIHKTTFEDIYGNREEVTFEVTCIDKEKPELEVSCLYNEDKTVTVYVESNKDLKNNKSTWEKINDRKYSKTFDSAQNYTTVFEDLHGNKQTVSIAFGIKKYKKNDFEVNVVYKYKNNGEVEVIVNSNKKLKNIKSSWRLENEDKRYVKTFNSSQDYSTVFTDIDENEIVVKINF